MSKTVDPRIAEERKLRQNPYAFLDENGRYSAIFQSSETTKVAPNKDPRITQSRKSLENQYAYLDDDGQYNAFYYSKVPEESLTHKIDINELNNYQNRGKPYSDAQIEVIVRKIQRKLWVLQTRTHGPDAVDPMELLHPEIAFSEIGYRFEKHSSLGNTNEGSSINDVAGYIDMDQLYAAVSTQYPYVNQRFTAAHELGHALLHPPIRMHRERSLDGAKPNFKQPRIEQEANKFASYFLMPKKQMDREFHVRFGSNHFFITDASAFALDAVGQDQLRKKYPSKRHLARRLAECNQFAGYHFDSLAARFGVSIEAMAIRIEELALISG